MTYREFGDKAEKFGRGLRHGRWIVKHLAFFSRLSGSGSLLHWPTGLGMMDKDWVSVLDLDPEVGSGFQ